MKVKNPLTLKTINNNNTMSNYYLDDEAKGQLCFNETNEINYM